MALGAKPEPVQNIELAMQVECPRDADGNPVGSYQYNGAVPIGAFNWLRES